MAFQTVVRNQPAPAIEGDFASANPRHSALTQQGGQYTAGPNGCVVARFVWTDPATRQTLQNYGSGLPVGFLHRNQQGLIYTWLAEATMLAPAGYALDAHDGGDFWVRNRGAGPNKVGDKAFANFGDGTAIFAAAGSSPAAAASATGSIAANTFSVTAAILAPPQNSAVGSILRVSAVGSGVVVTGATISGTGVTTGTKVGPQISGTPGGVGDYEVSIPQTAASTTVSGAYGTFTAASAVTGTFGVGQVLSGTGVTTGTTISALGTGAGGLGTYIVDTSQTAASATISAAGYIETKWSAATIGAAGELVKMQSQPLG